MVDASAYNCSEHTVLLKRSQPRRMSCIAIADGDGTLALPPMPQPERLRPMPLAARIRTLRESKGFSLEELASRAGISKTYLWELERDTVGAKKPSADVLLRVANALSTTIADLMSLPSVRVQESRVEEIPASLKEFQDRMKKLGNDLSEADIRDLSHMRFRGGQPQTADEWHALYLVLSSSTRKPKS